MIKKIWQGLIHTDRSVLFAYATGGLFALLALTQLLILVFSPLGRSWDRILLFFVNLLIAIAACVTGLRDSGRVARAAGSGTPAPLPTTASSRRQPQAKPRPAAADSRRQTQAKPRSAAANSRRQPQAEPPYAGGNKIIPPAQTASGNRNNGWNDGEWDDDF